MEKKCLLILLDGLGDRSHEALGFLTPLQAARTPNLDRLTASGACGLYHASLFGQALPSENAHFSMFGYDMTQFPGRGALEALGAGIDLGTGDVAVLGHVASLREKDGYLHLVSGKPRATKAESTALLKTVDAFNTNGIAVRFNTTHGLYGIITLHGQLSPFITDSDPFIDGQPLVEILPWESHTEDSAALNAAQALKSYLTWVWRSLKDHPVNTMRREKDLPLLNGIVTQRAGQLKDVTPFSECWGLRGLSIASGIVYHGLAAYIGMSSEKVTDTGDPGGDLARRLVMARNALDEFNFVHVHTKTPDESAHTKNPDAKRKVIESLDRGIGEAIGPILEDKRNMVVITADHSTPSAGPLIHSGEPVPLVFTGDGVRRDEVRRFDETAAGSGALGSVRGKELMYLVLNHLDRAKLQGVMDTPVDQPYWPGNYRPYKLGTQSP